MALRRQRPEDAEGERWLEIDASMTGTIAFRDPVNLQINGQFQGTLEAKGNLRIGDKAEVKADLRGDTVTVGGTVTGDLTAITRVELLSTARVTGNVTSPRVIMHDGAVLRGRLDMGSAEGADSSMTVDELARYLEVEAATVVQWAQSGRLPGRREQDQWRFDRAKIEEWLAHEKIK